MTTINTQTHYSPAVFKGEIQLPPSPPREHVDPTTTVLLQHASGGGGDLPAPKQIIFNQAVQLRLDKISDGYLPNVRRVLNECDAMQDSVMLRRREREAEAQDKAWEYGYEATLKNDKASAMQRNSKFTTAAGQMAGGALEARGGVKGLKDKHAAKEASQTAQGHEKTVAKEEGLQRKEARKAMELEKKIDTLERRRNDEPGGDEAQIDRELADTRKELVVVNKSIDSRSDSIQQETQAATTARATERHNQSNDAELALGRGMSACLNGAAGVAGAQLEHQGELLKNQGQRLQLLRDQEDQDARRSGSGAEEAQGTRGKYLDFGTEVTHLERPPGAV